MIRWLSKFFNIYPGEWRRVLVLSAVLALPNAGIIWGSTIAYTAFLKQVGLSALPWILVTSSIFSIIGLAIYTAFVDRLADDKLLLVIFALGVVGIIVGLGFLWSNHPEMAYPTLYLIFLVWAAVANPHLVTYVNSYYDVQSAKRVFPVVLAAGRAGAIVGGLSMPLLTRALPAAAIIFIWMLTYLLSMLAIWLMKYVVHEKGRLPQATVRPTRQSVSYTKSIKEGLSFTLQSSYLRWMALATFLLMILMAFLEYRSTQLMSAAFDSQEKFANFIGLLDGVSNVFVLPMLLFGISRLITRTGLANVSLFFPIANLTISLSLVQFPGVVTASIAYFDRKALRTSLQLPIDSLLFNAVPVRVRGRARAFVSGLIVPVGSLVGGLMLMATPSDKLYWFVPLLIVLLASAYLVNAIVIRKKYSQALVQMLQEEDYSFLLEQEASELPMADPATLRRLEEKLNLSQSHELRVFMCRLITQIGGAQSVTVIGDAIRNTPAPHTRSAMLEVLIAAELRGEKVQALYTAMLNDPAGAVRQSAISGLEQLTSANDRKYINQMLDLVNDTDQNVRARALTSLARSKDYYKIEPAVRALDELLESQDPRQRMLGVQVLGKINDSRAAKRLVDYLTDPDDQVRMAAVMAVEEPEQRVKDPQVEKLLSEKMGQLVQDPVERVRYSALMVLGQVGSPESYQLLAEALTDTSPDVRATAVNALAQVGKSIIPLVQPNLESSDQQLRKMSTVILSRVNPREYSPLIINSAIMGNLSSTYRNLALAEGLETIRKRFRSVNILQCALREQGQQLADEILYLLTAIHDSNAVHIIGESLRSENARTRANAAEALEALTTPQVARLITPLFDPYANNEQLLSLGRETWDIARPNPADALRHIAANTDENWMRALAIFSVGQIGAALFPPAPAAPPEAPASPIQPANSAEGSPPSAEEARPRRPMRRGGLDLFGALGGDAPAKTPVEEPARPVDPPAPPAPAPLITPTEISITRSEIESLIQAALQDADKDVRAAGEAAHKALTSVSTGLQIIQDGSMLSIIDRIIFLKEVPFFADMSVDQLKILANVCEEKLYEKDSRIFSNGDSGGVLYVVVNGRVGIEAEKRVGSFARIGDVEAYSYFGEANFFDNSQRSTNAVAIVDTLTLQLHRDPLIALARQNPELSLKLINTLSQRLRDANDRIAELTKSRPRELHKLFDQYE